MLRNLKRIIFFCCVLVCSAKVFGFITDVPLVKEQYLEVSFWLNSLEQPDKVLSSAAQIAAKNQQTFALQTEMQLLETLPEQYSAAELTAIINKVSAIPSSARFYPDGTFLTDQHWQQYRQNLNFEAIKVQNPLRFGLIVSRSMMLAFPTEDRVLNQGMNADLNRFQETGLFPAEAVAVLHQSTDQQWYLVRSYNYTGWVKADTVATGEREQVLNYQQQAPFLVVTGAKVFTAYNPHQPAVSELQLDMGIRLPLLSAAETGHNLHGQNPLGSHIVQLPVRQPDGSLAFTAALIPRSYDVHAGYLPYTPANIIRQAFKFLGERYGWGHDYNGRDCTGFISEIYRTFGLLMPRNSGQQGNGEYGVNHRFSDDLPYEARLDKLGLAKPGDLLYLPGHVVMYLGEADGQPFVIHDVHGLAYRKPDGSYYTGILNGVMVTPLLPLHLSENTTYLDRTYNIKSLH